MSDAPLPLTLVTNCDVFERSWNRRCKICDCVFISPCNDEYKEREWMRGHAECADIWRMAKEFLAKAAPFVEKRLPPGEFNELSSVVETLQSIGKGYWSTNHDSQGNKGQPLGEVEPRSSEEMPE